MYLINKYTCLTIIIFVFVFRLYLGHNRIGFVDKDAFNGVDRLIELVDLEGIFLFRLNISFSEMAIFYI